MSLSLKSIFSFRLVLTFAVTYFFTFNNKSIAQAFFPLVPGFNSSIAELKYDSTTNYLYASGFFSALADGTPMYSISRWNGSYWDSLGSGATQKISALEIYNGSLLAGGAFNSIGGVTAAGLGSWDGTSWSNMADFVSSQGYGCVLSMLIDGNDLYVGGCFDSINGIPAQGIARFDGQTWHTYPPLYSSFHYILTMIMYDNELYLGGNFDLGPGRADIVKFDGTNWVSVGGGLSGSSTVVDNFIIYQNKLAICGYFQTAFGDPGNNIAVWDGTNWSSLGDGVGYGNAFEMHIYDNKLLVGGNFNHSGNVPLSYMGVWDGSNWSNFNNLDFNNGIADFETIGSNLIIGGGFMFVNGQLNRSVISYDMTSSLPELIGDCFQVLSSNEEGKFTISSTCENLGFIKLQIINNLGQLVYQIEENNLMEKEIDLKSMSSGIYFLNLITTNNNYSKKLLKR